jgi:hypothetical protein
MQQESPDTSESFDTASTFIASFLVLGGHSILRTAIDSANCVSFSFVSNCAIV